MPDDPHSLKPPGEGEQDHFVIRDGVRCSGVQILVEMQGCIGLTDKASVQEVLAECVIAAKATSLHPHAHKFGEEGGVSAIEVLSESHVSVHTWPETDRYLAFDAFMCGNAIPENVIPVLQDHFKPSQMSVMKILRGVKEGGKYVSKVVQVI